MGRPAADLCKGQQSASSFLDPKLQRLIKDIQLKRSSLIGKNHVKPLMTNTSNYNFRELGLEAFNLRAESFIRLIGKWRNSSYVEMEAFYSLSQWEGAANKIKSNNLCAVREKQPKVLEALDSNRQHSTVRTVCCSAASTPVCCCCCFHALSPSVAMTMRFIIT